MGRELHLHVWKSSKTCPKVRPAMPLRPPIWSRPKKSWGTGFAYGAECPISILATGTPEEVRAQCKKLIDTVGKDGGYMMDASTGLDDARPENVKAMFEFTKEYGKY